MTHNSDGMHRTFDVMYREGPPADPAFLSGEMVSLVTISGAIVSESEETKHQGNSQLAAHYAWFSEALADQPSGAIIVNTPGCKLNISQTDMFDGIESLRVRILDKTKNQDTVYSFGKQKSDIFFKAEMNKYNRTEDYRVFDQEHVQYWRALKVLGYARTMIEMSRAKAVAGIDVPTLGRAVSTLTANL